MVTVSSRGVIVEEVGHVPSSVVVVVRVLIDFFLLNVGLTRTRAPTATPEDDRGEKA